MVNYDNGKIYKIEAINAIPNEKVYVGSTTKQYLSQRMYFHKYHYQRWKDGKCDKVMCYDLFDEYGVENCVIVLLETVNCSSKDELLSKERHYFKTLNCINKHNPRLMDEDKETLKEQLKVYRKTYRLKNRDKLNEINKQYQKDNKDTINERGKIKKECVCGSLCNVSGKTLHERTKKHLDYMKTIK